MLFFFHLYLSASCLPFEAHLKGHFFLKAFLGSPGLVHLPFASFSESLGFSSHVHCILAHHILCNASRAGRHRGKADTQENKDIEMCFLYTQEYRSECRSKTHSLINRRENIQGT